MPGVRVDRQKEVFDRVRERSRTTEWAEPFRELGRFSYERSLTLRHAPRAVKLLMRLSPNRLEAPHPSHPRPEGRPRSPILASDKERPQIARALGLRIDVRASIIKFDIVIKPGCR